MKFAFLLIFSVFCDTREKVVVGAESSDCVVFDELIQILWTRLS